MTTYWMMVPLMWMALFGSSAISGHQGTKDIILDYMERMALVGLHNKVFRQLFPMTHESLVGEVIEQEERPGIMAPSSRNQ